MIAGDIDTTYQTMQRDLFTGGLVGRIGPNAFAVWSAIKHHADFESGFAWPSVRRLAEMTGMRWQERFRLFNGPIKCQLLLGREGQSDAKSAHAWTP